MRRNSHEIDKFGETYKKILMESVGTLPIDCNSILERLFSINLQAIPAIHEGSAPFRVLTQRVGRFPKMHHKPFKVTC